MPAGPSPLLLWPRRHGFIDVLAPDLRANPHPYYAEMRRSSPEIVEFLVTLLIDGGGLGAGTGVVRRPLGPRRCVQTPRRSACVRSRFRVVSEWR